MLTSLILAVTLFVDSPAGRTVTEVPDAALHTTCVTITGSRTAHFDVIGDLTIAEDGRIVWTGDQLKTMSKTLTKDELAGVTLLRMRPFIPREDFGDGPTPIPEDQARPTKLNPECGACLSGHTCSINNQTECCNATTGQSCIVCKVCAPRAVTLDGE